MVLSSEPFGSYAIQAVPTSLAVIYAQEGGGDWEPSISSTNEVPR